MKFPCQSHQRIVALKKNERWKCLITEINYSARVKELILLVEQELDRLVPEEHTPYVKLLSAARYSVLSGGKRMRPVLTLATAEMFGVPAAKAMRAACALELVHTYSLIHDDLPCMDDDDFRRGKPSLHCAYPEGHAVLTGDFLLTYAFDVIVNDPLLTPIQKVKLISVLSARAGAFGMIGGQVMDLESESKAIDLSILRYIHQLKTGALITAAFEFGAILAEVEESSYATVRQFGQEIGLAFQVIDDLLDASDPAMLSDLKNEKATYVSLLGLEETKKCAETLLQTALETIRQLPLETGLLEYLATHLVHRKM